MVTTKIVTEYITSRVCTYCIIGKEARPLSPAFLMAILMPVLAMLIITALFPHNKDKAMRDSWTIVQQEPTADGTIKES
jgi:hypothetical protein